MGTFYTFSPLLFCTFWKIKKKFHVLCVLSHMSYVLCQMSHVICLVSNNPCHMSPVTNAKSYNNILSPANSPIISSKERSGFQNLKAVSVTRHETMKIIWPEISRTRTDKHTHSHTDKHDNATTDTAHSQSRWQSW